MDLGLQGKSALVTGSSRGIGRAIATALASEGVRVALSARGGAEVEAAARALPGAIAITGDVATSAGARDAVAATLAAFGSIDILVNNVGGSRGAGTFDTVDEAVWAQVLELNLNSAVWCSRHAVAWMRDHGGGTILNVSSVCGREYCTSAPYTAAKAALTGLTRRWRSTSRSTGPRQLGRPGVDPFPRRLLGQAAARAAGPLRQGARGPAPLGPIREARGGRDRRRVPLLSAGELGDGRVRAGRRRAGTGLLNGRLEEDPRDQGHARGERPADLAPPRGRGRDAPRRAPRDPPGRHGLGGRSPSLLPREPRALRRPRPRGSLHRRARRRARHSPLEEGQEARLQSKTTATSGATRSRSRRSPSRRPASPIRAAPAASAPVRRGRGRRLALPGDAPRPRGPRERGVRRDRRLDRRGLRPVNLLR